MVMKKLLCLHIIIFGIILFLMSCSKEQKKADNQPVAAEEHAITPVEVQLTDSTRSDSLSKTKEKVNVPSNQAVVNTYDEGYLDGEAMAEEDRLAGKPGMQVGMDDDEDDYEDGFDDGYDE